MTNQEVIEEIQSAIDLIIQTAVDVDPWAVEIAVEAMEKQIPKEPNMIQNIYNENLWHRYCPSCKNWIGMWNSRLKRGDMYNNSNSHICPYCGQVIDLEEE